MLANCSDAWNGQQKAHVPLKISEWAGDLLELLQIRDLVVLTFEDVARPLD